MRRRKKEKAFDKVVGPPSAEDALESSGRGTSSRSAGKGGGDALSKSPVQHRKRSLLGLSSVRDLVEQVQDSLSKTKQDPSSSSAAAANVGHANGALPIVAGNAQSSGEKAPRNGSSSSSAGSGGGGAGSNAASSAAATTYAAAAAAALPSASMARANAASLASGGALGTVSTDVRAVASYAPPKKKGLDLKLLSSGASLSLRTKRQAQFSPSPSEFKARERADTTDHPFCGVCAAPFTLMVRRQRCQVCGESVCAQCSSDKRHVEGQKGLQRVCDICIVEGPVVLDDNGMYAVGPSPAATPIAPSAACVAPISSANGGSAQRASAAPANASAAPANASVASTSRSGGGGKVAAEDAFVRSLFAESPPSASSAKAATSARTSGSRTPVPRTPGIRTPGARNPGSRTPGASGSKTPGGGGGGGTGGGSSSARSAARPPRSPASVAQGASPFRVGASGGGGGGAKALERAGAEAEAASHAEDDDADAEGGQSTPLPSAKARRRSKKARRSVGGAGGTPGPAVPPDSKSAKAAGRQHFWSGQSFSEYLGIGGGGAVGGSNVSTPVSRSAWSTPRGGGNAAPHAANASASAMVAPAAGNGIGSSSGGSGGGGDVVAKGRWESNRRVSGGDAAGATVGRGSAFLRDFIRGAGIHRLDPRRLSGALATVASRTGLDWAGAGLWHVLSWLLEFGEFSRGASNRSTSRRSSHRQSHGSQYYANGSKQHGSGNRGWRPGRRAITLGSLMLLASYRRYQVAHPEVTTEHVVGAASSLFLALVGFFAHAVIDLARDACGAVVPSLCGTREARIAAVVSRRNAAIIGSTAAMVAEQDDGSEAVVKAGASDASSGGDEMRDASAAVASADVDVADDGRDSGGGAEGSYEAEGNAAASDVVVAGHDLDQYFFL